MRKEARQLAGYVCAGYTVFVPKFKIPNYLKVGKSYL